MANLPHQAITEQDIKRLVQDYLIKSLPLKQKFIGVSQFQEENMSCNFFGQSDLLIVSHCKLHELSINILRRLPIYLVREFAIQVEYDSFWFWALTNDIVNRSLITPQLRDWELQDGFKALMAANFAKLNVHQQGVPSLERLNRATSEIVSQPVKDLVDSRDVFLMYICYPVLEGLAKFALSPLIDCDGNPLATFRAGHDIFHKGSRKINSLAKILRALEENGSAVLSKPDISNNLRDFRLEIDKIISASSPTDDGWDSIYDLRNASLHGVKGFQLRSGLLTNLICLILWNILDDQTLTKELQMINKIPMRFLGNNYYPPEL